MTASPTQPSDWRRQPKPLRKGQRMTIDLMTVLIVLGIVALLLYIFGRFR